MVENPVETVENRVENWGKTLNFQITRQKAA